MRAAATGQHADGDATDPATNPARAAHFCAAAQPRPYARGRTRSRSSFATTNWRTCSGGSTKPVVFDPELTRPEQRAALEKQAPLSPAEKQALQAYAKLRRKKSDPAIDEPGPPRLDALPPKLSAAEAFAAPFLNQTKLADAIRALGLSANDAGIVNHVFRVLGPRIKKHHAAVGTLETARGKLIQLSGPQRLEHFAGLVADFYAVRERLSGGIRVQLVSQPEGHLRATQVGPVLLIPIAPGSLNSTRRQAELLGVIVHELSHHMASQVSSAVRERVTRDVEGYLGLPNQRHENIFDEATQTAIGNIVFMKRNFPTAYDPDGKFYAYEPDNDFPYAIDSYARALAPHLERLLAMPGGFAGPVSQGRNPRARSPVPPSGSAPYAGRQCVVGKSPSTI